MSQYTEKMYVSPLESDRTTGMIVALGRLTPGFAATMSGLFHVVIAFV